MITFVGLQWLVVERLTGIPILETVRDDVIPALAGGLPQLAVTMLGMRLCLDASLPVIVAMALPGVLGLAMYAAIVRARFPATWADMRMLAARLAIRTSAHALLGRIVALLRRRHTAEPAQAEQERRNSRP